MVAFYRLDHFHSINGHFLESNIGTFSSYNLAESCIDKLINKPGYNLYPRSNFVITKVILGNIHWEKGFVTLITINNKINEHNIFPRHLINFILFHLRQKMFCI